MKLSKLEDDLNVHQSLPDQPIQTGNELKRVWDSAVNRVKDFLNNTLLAEIENKCACKAEDNVFKGKVTAQGGFSGNIKLKDKIKVRLGGAATGQVDTDFSTEVAIPVTEIDVSRAKNILPIENGGTGRNKIERQVITVSCKFGSSPIVKITIDFRICVNAVIANVTAEIPGDTLTPIQENIPLPNFAKLTQTVSKNTVICNCQARDFYNNNGIYAIFNLNKLPNGEYELIGAAQNDNSRTASVTGTLSYIIF